MPHDTLTCGTAVPILILWDSPHMLFDIVNRHPHVAPQHVGGTLKEAIMRRMQVKEEITRVAPALKADKEREVYMPGSTSIKINKDAQVKYVFDNLGLDFKTCTRSDIIKLAARVLVVDLATKFRGTFTDKEGNPVGDPMKVADQWDRTFNVKTDFIEAVRVQKSPEDKADAALAALPEDVRQAIIAKYLKGK
jgi:hypothetical protein